MEKRITQLAGDQGPLLEHVSTLETQISKLYEELATEHSKKMETSRLMTQKDAKVEALALQLTQTQHRLKKVELFAGENIYGVHVRTWIKYYYS